MWPWTYFKTSHNLFFILIEIKSFGVSKILFSFVLIKIYIQQRIINWQLFIFSNKRCSFELLWTLILQ